MNLQTAKSGHDRMATLVDGLKQRRSSVATLVAGIAILVLSAASGYVAQVPGEGIDWIELSIYLCAVVVVATQGSRLLRACVGLIRRPAPWTRARSGDGAAKE